ncbi:MAG: shikimate dehydrogenase [bacterium]|nr:shikimate dehydrogenase [bacterium]
MIHINGNTRVFGILGHPTGHSLSPLIHNAAFAAKKINAVYVPFDVAATGAALKRGITALQLDGLSVTIPHKAWAAKIADDWDDLTEYCGAANTLIRDPETDYLKAHNTDGAGAVRALKQHCPDLRGRRFLLLGYGGSATAIAHALLLEENPAMLAVAGRNGRKVRSFVSQLKSMHNRRSTMIRAVENTVENTTTKSVANSGKKTGAKGGARAGEAPEETAGYKDLAPEDIDVIIHTTPLGMQGAAQGLPLPADFIRDFHHVFDIVYNPMRTPLLKHAAAAGAQTVPGYLMLLYQAVIQFELFTGEKAPENLMEKELLAALRKRATGE